MFFTLSMLRRHLEGLGHGFRLSAIKEALNILSDTLIEIRLEADDEPGQSKRRRFMKGTILTNYTGDFAEADPTGEDSRAAMTFHPARHASHTRNSRISRSINCESVR